VIAMKFTWRERRPLSITIRRWREIGKRIHTELGKLWLEKFLPDHFTPGAAAKYRHQPRTRLYIVKKARRLARGRGNADAQRLGAVDLVFSGRMYRELTQNAQVIAYPGRATIKMVGPYYLSGSDGRGMRTLRNSYVDDKRGKKRIASRAKMPNMKKELFNDTPAQLVEIGARFDELLTEEVNRETGTITEEL